MSHHARSFSEQPQIVARVANGADGQPNNGVDQPQSFIRVFSDSQQSLDQLFNPTLIGSVPLRNRNLPSSFFNPSVKTETNGTNGTSNGNNLHNRSISFDHRNPSVAPVQRHNFHTRTHSTLAPMPRLDSNHSSHEVLNGDTNNNNNTSSNNNVSSCQQHRENIVSAITNNQHHHNNQQRHIHHHSHSNGGWSSVSNSMDDVSSTSWVASQPQQQPQAQPPAMAHQAMRVVQHHQPMIMHEHAIHIHPAQHSQPQNHHHHQHSVPANVGANRDQAMFYNNIQPTVAAADTTTAPLAATSHACPNHSLHNRSVSYHQRPVVSVAEAHTNVGFHMRTHSTVAPTTSTCHHHPDYPQQAISQHSSHQSSHEILNHSSATNSSAAAGWSSSGYSTDDMTSTGTGHGWPLGQVHHHPVPPQTHATHQAQPVAMDHQPSAAPPLTMPMGHNHNHHNHHHSHIPMQVQQQTACQVAPQQVFYNV